MYKKIIDLTEYSSQEIALACHNGAMLLEEMETDQTEDMRALCWKTCK
jgi:hypothetical protein